MPGEQAGRQQAALTRTSMCGHCDRWTYSPYGGTGDGYKAGYCALSGRLTSAIHNCDSYQERQIDLSWWEAVVAARMASP